jgi:putative FmdB family regulatory protein
MPIYSYKCEDCENAFDITATVEEKTVNDPNVFACPACESPNVAQKFSLNLLVNKAKEQSGDGGCTPGGGCCG